MNRHVIMRSSIAVGALLLGACQSTPMLSDKEYLSMSPEAQEAYRSEMQQNFSALELKKAAEYDAGLPVHYGLPNDGFTLQWNKRLNLVALCKGHTTGFTGIDSSLCAVTMADDHGQIGTQQVGGVLKPTVLLTNTSSQEGLGRLFIEGGFKVLAAGVNGAWAAEIRADSCSDGNCAGDTTLINAGGNSSAGAASGSSSNAASLLDFKASASCGNDPTCGGAAW
ncbi:hypothetical protein H6778_02805 [Candidatus Nomurabacteria bacterium]|nr:hypothetical protein [Candidatus Nomurabacteria bacterium]